MIRGFVTESEAIQARKPGEVVIVLNGRPCTARLDFIERLRLEGAAFQTARCGQERIFQVDFPVGPIPDVGAGFPMTDTPTPSP